MPTLLDAVCRTIRRHGLLPQGARVISALSGGADSVALLYALREIASIEGFLPRWRGPPESSTARPRCRRRRRVLPACSLPPSTFRCTSNVSTLRRSPGRPASPLEHAAHDARHEFFARAAALANASAVAVAHTRNDQAETFLLRLLRGAGPRGLGGMHPRSGIVVRPFIDTDRFDDPCVSRGRPHCIPRRCHKQRPSDPAESHSS